MSKQALIVWGGWDGHQPEEVAGIFAGLLREEGFGVEVSDTLDSFKDAERLAGVDLIVPVWTMGKIESEQLKPLITAVKEGGTGIAGCHGGMGDSFRNEVEYQYMVGGQWVAHPGNDGVTYTVRIKDRGHQLTEGMDDFVVVSEKYYMHVDPAIHVHAVTDFGDVEMPVVWTKTYGAGKVYYNSLGHQANIVRMPETLELMRRGLLWATR
ncbi:MULTISPECIES: ThuA domain-containing protein [unclassified Paenibacillus]|uniref:ThuA domain-containing protein n=1 Tax=unclassified Paenibacillus TaxID=185978 RepID=UPI00277FFA58|nr:MULTISPECIES: ThuA domain-containing protein [unclassified Paenibacillus]MDQ0901805.1 type 1 glutamine amidotransferase [Paenibacillus sp. V4I7]MDQ0919694.1 type 1 glutamine amidotransferase [Paenibacillus sp. V4I5]